MHKNQIERLKKKVEADGFTIIPLKVLFADNGKVKVVIALGKGKKLYDKREDAAKKDIRRENEREFKIKNL